MSNTAKETRVKPTVSLATTTLVAVIYASLPACAPTGTPSSPTPSAREPSPPTTTPASAQSWTPRLSPGAFSYEIRTEGSIQLDADSARQQVPIDSRLLYTISLSPQGQLVRIVGTVDSLSTAQLPSTSPRSDSGSTHAPWFGVTTPTGQVRATQADSTTCGAGLQTGPQVVVQPVHELLVGHPPTLTAGAHWKDTTVTTTCRGQVLVISTAVNDFRLEGANDYRGTPALRISRSSEITIRGAGRESGRSISLTGGGGGKATMYVDQTRGIMLESSSESRTVITVKTLTGEVPFRQQVRQEVKLRPR